MRNYLFLALFLFSLVVNAQDKKAYQLFDKKRKENHV